MDNNNQSQSPQPAQAPEVPSMQPPQPSPQPAPNGGTSYQMPPKNNKNFVWIGILVGAVVLIGIIIAVLFAVFSVSKEDYREAYSQMGEVSSANSRLSTELSSIQYSVSSATDTKFDNDAKAIEDSISKIREENEKLGELKAMKVGEGKDKYQEFNEKLDKSLTFISDAVKSLKDIRDAASVCDDTTSTSSSDAAAVKGAVNKCVDALKEIDDTPNEDVKEYAKGMSTEMENLSSIVDKTAGLTDPYGSQYSQYKSLRDQLYDVQSNLQDIVTDFRSNFEKHAKEASVKDQANDLIDFLEQEMK